MILNRLAKKIQKAFSPKRISKATRKVVPKIATGGLILGAGIGAEKLMTDHEDQPIIAAEAPEDSNLVDRSYSFIKVEDVTNGQSAALTSPARVSTIIMIVLILIGLVYPIYCIYKRIASCLNKRRQTNMDNSIKNQDRFRKEISKRDPEGATLNDDHDSRVLAAIANQEVLYEGGETSVSTITSHQCPPLHLQGE